MSAMRSRIRESRAGIVATVAVIMAAPLVPFGYVYETSHIRYSFKAARGGYDGTVTLHAGEGGKLSKAADFQRGKSVDEYHESYTSTARAYIMPVIVEALSLVAVCAVTFWLMRRAA